ncbi:5-nucleotidase, putative [Babesia caballi]|uniref:5-nucleotidase, putative n=1 Tax=Babesia caballi TaxID=5871 RepID=A0AAV4LP97_BABCB|nr:5-nucleotidase, putative [Babesia caballi]
MTLSAVSADQGGATAGEDKNGEDNSQPQPGDDFPDLQRDEVEGSPATAIYGESMLRKFRDAVLREGLDKELTDLVLSAPDRLHDQTDRFPLSKCDWFHSDEPLDSDDELLVREYCSQRVPDMEAIYKKLDPHGVRKYVPTKLTTMEKTLGRVYEVNQPLLDEEVINQSQNIHELPQRLRDDANQLDTIPDADANNNDGSINPSERNAATIDVRADKSTDDSVAEVDTSADDCAGQGTAESDSDEEDTEAAHRGDSAANPHDDSVIQDEAYRYFVTLPMLSWTTYDRDALEVAISKLTNYHKHHKETPRALGTSSPYSVFTAEPCSSVGVNDGSCDMSLEAELSALKTVKINPTELSIEEYKHSDLLNDIDAYEAAEYPTVVQDVCTSDATSPIFTMDDFAPTYSDVDVVDPLVYVSVPKSSVQDDKTGLTVVNEEFFVKRVRDQRLSCRVPEIPLNSQPQIGTILIPNEFTYRDQNIRYLADEIGVISRSLVFVPDVSSNDLVFALTLNRLIKLVQTAFNVDRIALVALGGQGRRVMHYVSTAMRDTVQRTLHDFRPLAPKCDPDKYRTSSNITRLESILRRQSTAMADDILSGIRRMEHDESLRAAEKARDYHVVKPLCNILQSIVLWDSVGVNFKEVAELGVPVLLNLSNRVNLFENLLRLDNPKFISQKLKCSKNSTRALLNVFDFFEGPVPPALSEVLGQHVRLRYVPDESPSPDNPDTYHMSTNHTGIDVCLKVFPQASGHFYMKKPGASRGELNALGNAILSCADWINSWCF